MTHPLEYAGQEYSEKLDWLRQTLSDDEKHDYLAMVITEQDEIAWMFNMRGEGESVVEVNVGIRRHNKFRVFLRLLENPY